MNARLGARLMRGWVLGVAMFCSILCQTFLDAAFGAALPGLYPPNDDNKARYQAWLKGQQGRR